MQLNSAGRAREVVLPVGDDVAGAAKQGRLVSATLRVRFEGKAAGDTVELRVRYHGGVWGGTPQ